MLMYWKQEKGGLPIKNFLAYSPANALPISKGRAFLSQSSNTAMENLTPQQSEALESLRLGIPQRLYTDPTFRGLQKQGLVRWNGSKGWVLDTWNLALAMRGE